MNGPVVSIARTPRQPSRLELHFITAEIGNALLMKVLNRDWVEGLAAGAHLEFDEPAGLAVVVHPDEERPTAGQ